MKNIIQFLNESFQLNESFCTNLIPWMEIIKKDAPSGFKTLCTEIAIGNVLDEDVLNLNSEEAKKMCYKKSSNGIEFILWFNENSFCGATLGLKVLVNNGAGKSVRTIATNSTDAILIININKYDVNAIRQARREARESALALKSDIDIAKANMRRWKEEAGKRLLQNDVDSTIKYMMDEVTKKYINFISTIEIDEDLSYNYTSNLRDRLEEINGNYKRILTQLIYTEEELNHAKKYPDDKWELKNFKREFDKLKERINDFEKIVELNS